MGDSESHRNIDQDYFALIRRRSTRPRLANFTDQRPSRKERLAAGKQLRKAVPRKAHATYRAPDDRANPVDILEAQDTAGCAAGHSPWRTPSRATRPRSRATVGTATSSTRRSCNSRRRTSRRTSVTMTRSSERSVNAGREVQPASDYVESCGVISNER